MATAKASDSREAPVAHLTRRYDFAASHRLDSKALSADENRRVYGKCNNPYVHGHNYSLEVTVAGPISGTTGMVVNLADLDRVVREEILDRFDHTNLNVDVENFRGAAPTSENLIVEIHRLLCNRWGREAALREARLAKVLLQETGRNSFEYLG